MKSKVHRNIHLPEPEQTPLEKIQDWVDSRMPDSTPITVDKKFLKDLLDEVFERENEAAGAAARGAADHAQYLAMEDQ